MILITAVAAAALAVAVKRCAVLGGACAAGALGVSVFAFTSRAGHADLAAVALLALGAGVTAVGELVWRALGEEGDD